MEISREFLNQKSMLTPGMAGGFSMAIANTVAGQFDLDEPWPAAVALALACLFGLLAVAAEPAAAWLRVVYFVLNSLVIFTVAVGSNTLGQVQVTSRAAPAGGSIREATERLAGHVVSPPAHAQTTPESSLTWCCLNGRVNQAPRDECERWGGRLFPRKDEAQLACRAKPDQPPRTGDQDRFFRPWFQKR
jgi:hypothetical protein